jgi:hypothetical protein
MKKAFVITMAVGILAGACLAQSPRLAEVVAEVGLVKQTGTVGGTLYTPNEAGVFRVTFYVQCTMGSEQTGKGLFPILKWRDDVFSETFAPAPSIVDSNAGAPTSYIFVIKDIAGKPVTWRVATQPGDTSEYEVYIALERIGPVVQ